MRVVGSKLFLGLFLATSLVANAAEEFPQRAVKLVIPSSAGGLTDQMGRALGEAMSASLGQPFVVDNKPGAGATMTGVTMVSTKPDGYTIGMITCATLKLPHTTKTSYDPTKHLTYIGRFSGAQMMVAVRADAPWKTLAELTEASRRAKDGVFYGVVGSAHLFGAQLADASNLNSWRSVPYKGETDSIMALLSDEVKFLVVSNTIMPFVSSGKVRVLGVFGNQKLRAGPGCLNTPRPEISGWAAV